MDLSTISAAVIGALATIIGAYLAARSLLQQSAGQAAATREAEREGEARRLKLRIYEDVIRVAGAAGGAAGALEVALRYVPADIANTKALAAQSGKPHPAMNGPQKIHNLTGAFGDAVAELVFTAERWTCIDPRILIFRDALQSAMHDFRHVYNPRAWPWLIRHLPMDNPRVSGEAFGPAEGTPDLQVAHDLMNDTCRPLSDVTGYVIDFQNELQHLLVADLFGHDIPRRTPLDPRLVAIRLADYETLTLHFRKATAWGKWLRDNEDLARRAIEDREMRALAVEGAPGLGREG